LVAQEDAMAKVEVDIPVEEDTIRALGHETLKTPFPMDMVVAACLDRAAIITDPMATTATIVACIEAAAVEAAVAACQDHSISPFSKTLPLKWTLQTPGSGLEMGEDATRATTPLTLYPAPTSSTRPPNTSSMYLSPVQTKQMSALTMTPKNPPFVSRV
jgi:hypothetical protein